MLTVNGLYGHVARNNMRSVWMFLGFIIAYQLVGAALLALPLLFLDVSSFPFRYPISYFLEYGWIVMILSAGAFAYRYSKHMKSLQDELGFDYVSAMQNPRLVGIVERVAIPAGIDVPRVAILPVNALNAFACGVKAASSTVVVTDGLLRALDDDELEAVIAHEITHIVNGDIRSMAFANVSISSLMKLAKFNLLKIKEGWGRAIFGILFPPFMFLSMASGLVMHLAMTVARVTRLLIASSREYVADAEAVRLTHKPAALISALRKIEGRSEVPDLDPIADAMMIDGATIGEFATHPTIAERIQTLQQHAGSMAYDTGARNDTRGVAGMFGAIDGVFGRKQAPAPKTEKVAVPGNLFQRVNKDNDQNMFGATKGMRQKMKIVGYVFVGFILLSSWQMQRNLKGLQRVEPGISSETSHVDKPAKNSVPPATQRLATKEAVAKRPAEQAESVTKVSLTETEMRGADKAPSTGKHVQKEAEGWRLR